MPQSGVIRRASVARPAYGPTEPPDGMLLASGFDKDAVMYRLPTQIIDKPWGRHGIGDHFAVARGRKVGEIWFEAPFGQSLDVMVKYLFTSERLSIQVHPDETTAQARGLAHGKDECWIILDAEPGAEIALGTREPMTVEALLDAARDGRIADLVDWRPASRGQFIYSAAGTVHALGAGLTVLEVQQATDATYRLFDYGRPRELHLEESRDVIDPRPHVHQADSVIDFVSTRILVDGPYFGAAWCVGTPAQLPNHATQVQVLPIDAAMELGGAAARPGECWLIDDPYVLRSEGAFLLAWSRA